MISACSRHLFKVGRKGRFEKCDPKEKANFVNRMKFGMPRWIPMELELLQVLWGLLFSGELRNSLEIQTAVGCRGTADLLDMDIGPEGVLLMRDRLGCNCV